MRSVSQPRNPDTSNFHLAKRDVFPVVRVSAVIHEFFAVEL